MQAEQAALGKMTFTLLQLLLSIFKPYNTKSDSIKNAIFYYIFK